MQTKKTLNFQVQNLSGMEMLDCTVDQLIMAGWVGRNREALQAHIDELAELGIPGPKNVPEFYPLSVDRLSQGSSIQVSGKDTSGEVEFFLICQGSRIYVGLGSDQTDRDLESKSITLSKQICDKVLCSTLWPFEEVQQQWDCLRLRAWIEDEDSELLYQEGLLGEMIAPQDLFDNRFGGELPEGTVLFGEGWELHTQELKNALGWKAIGGPEEAMLPSAVSVAFSSLSSFQSKQYAGDRLSPRYIQRAEAEVQWEVKAQKSVPPN